MLVKDRLAALILFICKSYERVGVSVADDPGLAFDSTTVLFLAFRFIPLLYFLYLHIGHAMTTIIQSRRAKPLHAVECIDGLTDFRRS